MILTIRNKVGKVVKGIEFDHNREYVHIFMIRLKPAYRKLGAP